MIRATTPTFTLTISGDTVDLTLAQNIYVTIKQGTTEIEMTGDELMVVGNVVQCFLSQEESLKLIENTPAKIQANWTYIDADGVTIRRAATKVKEIHVGEQLLKRVIV